MADDQEYFKRISYYAHTSRLGVFLGAGVTKDLTGGVAPSWPELLLLCGSAKPELKKVLGRLFEFDNKGAFKSVRNGFALPTVASILATNLVGGSAELKDLVAQVLSDLNLPSKTDGVKKKLWTEFFADANLGGIAFVTTNYERVLFRLAPNRFRVTLPSGTISILPAKHEALFLHGSIREPQDIVLTEEDYYQFNNQDSYVKRKFQTLLAERAFVLIGYGVADPNIKQILVARLREPERFRRDAFLCVRGKIDPDLRRQYETSFRIHILENLEIAGLLSGITKHLPLAVSMASQASNLHKVLEEAHAWSAGYIRNPLMLSEILATIDREDRSLNDSDVAEMLGEILDKKIAACREPGAWEQYEHLANWLVDLGARPDFDGVIGKWSEATKFSLSTAGGLMGQSWAAQSIWNSAPGRMGAAALLLLDALKAAPRKSGS